MANAIISAICSLTLIFYSFALPSSYGDNNIYTSKSNDNKNIALTFDDGPHEKYTKEIIEILEENGVPATFFVIGKNAEQNSELVRLESNCGFEIGSHTYSHRSLRGISACELEKELDECNKVIEGITGNKTCLFRPPEGICSQTVRSIAREKHYPIILWSVDTNDWRGISSDKIVNTVKKNVKPGSIILFHDYVSGKSGTPDALRELIPYLKNEGYSFVTVSQLLGL